MGKIIREISTKINLSINPASHIDFTSDLLTRSSLWRFVSVIQWVQFKYFTNENENIQSTLSTVA